MADAIRFEIKLPQALATRIDEWRRRQPDIPNRAQAARDLIERGLAPQAPAVAVKGEEQPPPPLPSAETLAQCGWLARDFQDHDGASLNTRVSGRIVQQVDFLVSREKVRDKTFSKKQFVEDALREACQRELARLGIAP